MKLLKPLIAALLLLSAPLVANAFAAGDVGPSGLEGKAVVGQDGVLLGHVERVVLGANGAPAQVLVKPKGLKASGPRSLAFKALRVSGEGLSAPLSKAEFDAMPAIEPRAD